MFAVSIFAALGAAVSFALAAIFQQEAARATDPRSSLSIRLLAILLRRRKWLAGVCLLLCGYGLQALALSRGPVAVVQPIVATELAFAVPIAIWRLHRRAGKREWAGIVAVLAGVSIFLLVASPVPGRSQPDGADWLRSLIPVGAVIAGLVLIASKTRGPRRAVLLGCAAGLAFALLAILTKAVTYNLSVDVPATFTNWEVYLLVALGISALVISQSAYQAGPLALSMPAIALLEPAVAVVIGDTVFNEQARLAGVPLAVEILAAGLAAAGLLGLATSPTVTAIYQQSEPSAAQQPPTGGKRPVKDQEQRSLSSTPGRGAETRAAGDFRPWRSRSNIGHAR
jgi:drug/metabolite transporter (DMT)-like permease